VAYDKKPVGNGPYTVTKVAPRVEAVVTRDKNYHGWVPTGAAKSITFRVYTDTNTAYQDVVAGNAEVLRSLPPGLVAQGRNALGTEGLTAVDKNTLETYLAWPTYLDQKFPLEVRQAFSMIIDRNSISKDLFKGSTEPARSLMPNSVTAFRSNPCGDVCQFDPATAKAMIAKSGFTDTIPIDCSAANTTDAATALAISNEAKKIGLTVAPRPLAAANLANIINEKTLDGPAIQLWGSSFAAQDAWGATSTKEADALWQKSEDSVLADQVLQPLYYQVMYIAHTKCVVPHSAGGDMQIYRTEVTC